MASRPSRASVSGELSIARRSSRRCSVSSAGLPGDFIPGETDPIVFTTFWMKAAMGNVLPAWLRWFDPDGDGMVTLKEFSEGMRKCGYDKDCKELFEAIDEDESGFLTLYEVDLGVADLWAAFRSWAATTFQSTDDMVTKLRGQILQLGIKKYQSRHTLGKPRDPKNEQPDIHFIREQFAENAARLGWYGAYEDVLYDAMDKNGKGSVSKKDIKFFEKSKHMSERRQAVKPGNERTPTVKRQSSVVKAILEANQSQSMLRSLLAFINLLRSRNKKQLMRAWRTYLDPRGNLYTSKADLVRTCTDLAWKGDPTSLWNAISDASEGFANLEDLCVNEARELCVFKQYCEKHFGNLKNFFSKLLAYEKARQKKSKPSKEPLYSDDERADAVERSTFLSFFKKIQGDFDPSSAWILIDYDGQGTITYQDELKFLESWTPAIWLSEEPGVTEAARFKAELLEAYQNHPVKAWRQGIDTNGSGMARWGEFHGACQKIGWTNESDMAKAWVALSISGLGFLTMRQIDEHMADALANFRRWCYAMHGSVVLAFKELDKDDNGTLSYEEFTSALDETTFKGDVTDTWYALNQDGDKMLSKFEVYFLDEMELDVLEAFIFGTYFNMEGDDTSRPGSPESGNEEQEDELNMEESIKSTNTLQDDPLPSRAVRKHLTNVLGLAGNKLDYRATLDDSVYSEPPPLSTPIKATQSHSRSQDHSHGRGDGPARSARQQQQQLPELPSPKKGTPRSARALPWPSRLPPRGTYVGGGAYMRDRPRKLFFSGLD